jgi:hypothetical protein
LPLAAAERCEAAESVTLPISEEDRSADFDPVLRLSLEKAPALIESKARSPRKGELTFASGVTLRPLELLAVAACLFLIASAVGYEMWRLSTSSRVQKEAIGRLGNQVGELGRQVSDLRAARNEDVATLQDQLSQSREGSTQLAERAVALQQKLDAASSQVQSLVAQLGSDQGREAALTQRLRDEESKLSQMSDELKSARTQPVVGNGDTEAEKAKLESLEAQLLAEKDGVEREKRLLTADRDIRDLMGARNLHIIDVFEVDGKGRTEKPFGRVFFTEGKSLIFYAFDLGNKKTTAENASFQVWGAQESDSSSAQSLGIFYEDNKADHRWMLKVDDPTVLAEINQVFVTVEPQGGSKKPTGSKMLYAYLNSHLNHP